MVIYRIIAGLYELGLLWLYIKKRDQFTISNLYPSQCQSQFAWVYLPAILQIFGYLLQIIAGSGFIGRHLKYLQPLQRQSFAVDGIKSRHARRYGRKARLLRYNYIGYLLIVPDHLDDLVIGRI